MSDLDEEEYEYTRRLNNLKPIEGTKEYYILKKLKSQKESINEESRREK